MSKYKKVTVDCFKDDRFPHYGECYQNITDEELEKELNRFIKSGFNKLVIIADNEEKILILDKKRK